MKILYPARIKYIARDDRYFVQFLDLDEAVTEGETFEEALFNASEVLTLSLEGRIEEGMELPAPSKSKARDVIFVAPSPRVQAALLLRVKLDESSHTKAEIARALGTSWPSISRSFDPHHWPPLKQLDRIASALGQRLISNMEPTETEKNSPQTSKPNEVRE